MDKTAGTQFAKVENYEQQEDGTYKVSFENGTEEIYSDEEFYLYSLYTTDEPLTKTYDELYGLVQERRAYLKAMTVLRGSLKPESYVKKQLSSAGFDDNAIDSAIIRLRSEEATDDFKYCTVYVRKKKEQGNVSSMYMRMELKTNGIDENIIDDVMENEAVDDRKTAAALAEKKRRNGDSEDKIRRYLSGKGFGGSVIRAVTGNGPDESFE